MTRGNLQKGSVMVASLFAICALTSACLAQGTQISKRALQEIGLDSTYRLHTQVLWQDGSGNSITTVTKETYKYLVTVKTRVHRANLPETPNHPLIITERVEEIEGSSEDNLSELHATAMLLDTSGPGEQIWEFTEEADEGRLTEERWVLPYYVTAEFGCCDAQTLYKAHCLKTDETVMRFHSNLENSWKGNYFACSKEESPLSNGSRDSLFVGVLYWADENAVLHALKLRATDSTAIERMGADPYYWPWTVEITDAVGVSELITKAQCNGAGPIVCSTSKQDFPEKNIVARVEDNGPIIIIPIKDDDFVLERTKVNGFELIRLK